MHIPIPEWFIRACGVMLDWLNVPVWKKDRIELRRVDFVLALFGILCVAYYTYLNGWTGAVFGLLVFVLSATAGFVFRK